VEVCLEQPECLSPFVSISDFVPDRNGTHQQRSVHRFLAKIQYKFLQSHRLIVDAYDEVAQLREEELDFLVGELAELGAQHVVDADMVCIPPISYQFHSSHCQRSISYDRYATERNGFWLKTSLSMNRLSRSQDIGWCLCWTGAD